MAKVTLELIADTSVLNDVSKGLNDVGAAAKKSGEDQKKAFKDGADGARAANIEIKSTTDQYLDAITKRKVNLENEIKVLNSYKDAQKKAFDPISIKVYNDLIKQSESNIVLLGGTIKKTAAESGKLSEGIGGSAAIGKFKGAFGALRTLANIIPGIGISGLILQGYTFLIALFETFTSSLKVNTEQLELNHEAFDRGNKERLKTQEDLIKSQLKLQESTGQITADEEKRQLIRNKLAKDLSDLEKQRQIDLVALAKSTNQELILEDGKLFLKKKDDLTFLEKLDQTSFRVRNEELAAFNNQRESIDKIANDTKFNLEKTAQNEISTIKSEANKKNQKEDDKAAEKARKAAEKAESDRLADLKKRFDFETQINQTNFNREQADLKTQFSNTLLTEDEFNRLTIEAKQLGFERQLETIQKFNAAGLDLRKQAGVVEVEQEDLISSEKIRIIETQEKIINDLLDKSAAATKKREDNEVKAIEARAEIYRSFAVDLGTIFGELFTKQEVDFKEFTKQLVLTLLDAARKTILLLEAEALAKNVAIAGPAGLATGLSQIAIIEGLFAAAKAAVNASFHEGGYTGDGGKYDEAGVVHKGEFVHTKEKTQKHKKLFEAIHNNDYSKLSSFDLAPILKGTGVVLNENVPMHINNLHNSLNESKANQKYATDERLMLIQKDLQKFFDFYKIKPQERVLANGTKIIKKGNVTRIIRGK